MMGRQNKEIPVYVFMGFLESGKTTFAKETLMDRGFTGGAKTLLLVCEDGEEEYDLEALKKANIYTEFIEEDQLTTDHLLRPSGQIQSGTGHDRVQWYVEAR